MNKVITTAGPEHAVLLSRLSRETFFETFSANNSKEDMDLYLSTHFFPENIKEEFREPNARYFIAWKDDQPVGYAKMSSKYHPAQLKDRKLMEIERIYVKASWHGTGTGWALMQQCMDFTRSVGRNTLWLGVWERNEKAIRFYERAGFQKFGEQEFLLGKDKQCDWMMYKGL